MKFKYYIPFILLFFTLFMVQPTSAQYAGNYVVDGGNPRGLNTGTDAESIATWDTLLAGSQATNLWSDAEALPFSFDFFGTTVTHFKVSANGLFTFDTTVTGLPPNVNTNLPHPSLPNMTIAGMWDEFTAAPPTGSNDRVVMKLYGTAPAQQLWIKWFSFEYGNPNISFGYFSIVLEETSNNVFVVDMYGSASPLLTTTVGLQENATNAVQFGDSLLAQAGNGSSNTDNDYWEFFIPLSDDIGANYLAAEFSTTYGFVGDPATIHVGITNFGLNAASGFDIGYMVDDGSSATQAYGGTLNPGASDTIAFTTQWTPATAGTFALTGYTAYGSDLNNLNDTTSTSADVIDKATIDFTEDFENYTGNPSTIGWYGANNENFGMFIPSPTNDGSWTRDDFGNDPAISGDAARFLFTSTTADDQDWIITPPIDMTTGGATPTLDFDIAVTPSSGTDSSFIPAGDTLFVVYSTDGMNWPRSNILAQYTNADTIPPIGMRESIDLSSLATENELWIGFLAMDPANASSANVYIDNVFVGIIPQFDLAVSNLFDFPLFTPPSTSVSFDVEVINLGIQSIASANLDIWLNGAVVNTYPIATLASGELDTIAASLTTSSSGPDQVIAALQMVPGDANPANDTLRGEIVLPPGSWTEMWETTAFNPATWPNVVGSPEIIDTNGVATGVFPFPVPSYPYFLSVKGAGAIVESGVFDLTGLSGYTLSLWESEHDLEVGEDVILEYYSSAMVWDTLFYFIGTNNGFGTYEPFEKMVILLPTDAYHSMFQIRFSSIGALASTDEWYFDNLELGPAPTDIAAVEFVEPKLTMTPLSQAGLISAIPLAGTFRNLGLDNTGDLTIDITDAMGSSVHTETLSGVTINGFSDSTFTFLPADATGADSGLYVGTMYASNFTDNEPANDSMTTTQVLGDQMAFDFGVQSTSGTFSATARSWFATRFTLTDPDTIRAVKILVSASTVATDSFAVELWSVVNDSPDVAMATVAEGVYSDLGSLPALVNFEIMGGYALPAGDFAIVFDMKNTNSFPCGVDFTAMGADNIPNTFWGKLETTTWLPFETVGAGNWTPIIRGVFNMPEVIPVTYTESFEGSFPPMGWGILSPDGGTGWEQQAVGTSPVPGWTGGTLTGAPNGENNLAFCTWTTGGSVSNDQWLVSPQLLDVQRDHYFSFWLRYWPDNFADTLDIFISTTDNSDPSHFTTHVAQLGFGAGSDTNWVQYSFDLTNYVSTGEDVYIGFQEHVDDNFNDGASFSYDLFQTNGVVNMTGGQVEFFDGFESYTAGTQLVVQNPIDWTTWSGGAGTAEDPFISDAFAYNGNNSVNITGTNDVVYPIGNYTSGKYKISVYIYVPTGGDAYFNTLQLFAGAGSSWGMQVYFGDVTAGAGLVDAGGAGSGTFTFNYDTWIFNEIVVDLDADFAEYFVDGVSIVTWQWSTGAFGSNTLNQLGGSNFFAWTGGVNLNPDFYFDNYTLARLDTPVVAIGNNDPNLPTDYALYQNYPNPFNPTTTIQYDLKQTTDVTIKIFNMLGQEVRTLVNSRQEAGQKEVVWDGLNNARARVASGIYIYRIQAGDFVQARKMILMK
jgi:hypothetical protein